MIPIDFGVSSSKVKVTWRLNVSMVPAKYTSDSFQSVLVHILVIIFILVKFKIPLEYEGSFRSI
jgi:hypothetical protein